MSTLHERLGLGSINADAVRAMLVKSGVQVKPRLESYVPKRSTATKYLDGEEQREKKALLAASDGIIAGLFLREIPVRFIATIFGVTDMAIYKRLNAWRLVGNRRLPVNGQVANEERLGVEVNDDDPQIQPAAYELQAGQLFLFGVNRLTPPTITKSIRFCKYAHIGPRVPLKLKTHRQELFDYVR